MSKKAVIITVISLGVVGAAVFGGIKAYQNYQNKNQKAEVHYVSELNMYYYENEMSSSGIVTNDSSQDVYALEDKVIAEVHVEEGQEVKAGDPLITYDMTMSNLELEMKELDVSTITSRLEAAKQQLSKLKSTTPVSPRPEEPEEPEPEPMPEEPEPTPVPLPPQKTKNAYNYITSTSKPNKGKGTEEKPYIYLCTQECFVFGEFINSLSADEDDPIYVSLEIHKNNEFAGKLITSWEISGESGFPRLDEDSKWSVRTRSQMIEEEPEEPDIIEPEEPDIIEPEEPEEPEGYTAEELSSMIKEKEEEIRDLDLSKRKEELELEQMKKVSGDGVVKAAFNGVVKGVADKDDPPSGEPFLTVSGSEGLYVSGSLSELQLEEIKVGQKVYANSWESGQNFEAEITEISQYPMDNSNAYGEGNPNVSYYPYTAYIENTEGLRNGEYVDLTMSNTQEKDGIYLDKAFVREEDGRKYVLKADENDLLVKQYIQTGKTIWGQAVEVLSGLTMEDRVAFPYGKTAKEGVKVTESE